MTLILASQSAARAAMLRAAGVAVEPVPARIDEAAIKAALLAEGAPPRDVADVLAEQKALRVSARHPEAFVLGADQVLVLEDRLFDKPRSRAEAAEHLAALSGKRHELLSAAVIARAGAPVWRHVGTARLTMRRLSAAFIADYLDRAGEGVLSSVGCYQIEGLGAQLFARVEGDHFTVQGLPLLEVLGFLRANGVLAE